jgi:hypothetical protein
MLVAKIDELVAMTIRDLDEIRAVDRPARAGAGPVVPERRHDVCGEYRRSCRGG